MYYSGLDWYSTQNGEGIRIALFVSGCRIHCKNCFNKEAWDFHYGKEYTSDIIRAYGNSELNVGAGDKTLTFPQSAKCIVLAIPATMTVTTAHSDQISDLTIDSFTNSTVQVADVRGGDNGLINYTVYTYTTESGLENESSITFTLAYVED